MDTIDNIVSSTSDTLNTVAHEASEFPLVLFFIVCAAVIVAVGITYILVIAKPRMNHAQEMKKLEYDQKIKEKEIELKQSKSIIQALEKCANELGTFTALNAKSDERASRQHNDIQNALILLDHICSILDTESKLYTLKKEYLSFEYIRTTGDTPPTYLQEDVAAKNKRDKVVEELNKPKAQRDKEKDLKDTLMRT